MLLAIPESRDEYVRGDFNNLCTCSSTAFLFIFIFVSMSQLLLVPQKIESFSDCRVLLKGVCP